MTSKRLFSTAALLCFALTGAFAQATSSPFLFPEFSKATVLQKGGGVAEAMMDYNVITQEMMFAQEGKNLVLDDVSKIDTVYINSRRFVPVKDAFYERLTNTPVSLYVQHKSTAVNSSNAEGAGNNNAIGGFVGAKQVKGSSKLDKYAMQLPAGFALRAENVFYLQKDGPFFPATDAKKIAKAFPGKEEQVAAYIKENNLNLADQAGLIKLTEYLNK